MTEFGIWHKSSYSAAAHQDCVEVRENPHTVDLRDTQHRHLGKLTVPRTEWTAFLNAVRTHEL
ncbi:DUF397 domain-containing protein [Lipingzhangella sp. LS1_29]|uniref:DUF397 domain-containing protein n=1 Tax=Lipingzhangella rawalii TaxID=2055835 RepID=A0ABU2HAC7_9ACTN|nr:DUF397 domain-containing protein [Lipingzhangella rawalii]MDS1271800.1 DUF397 domain-containing protein [Lipingzhangella rawalii]